MVRWVGQRLCVSRMAFVHVLVGVMCVLAMLVIGPVPGVAASGDTMTLTNANGTTFAYAGTTAAAFTAVFTFATKPTRNWFMTASLEVDNNPNLTYPSGPASSISPDGLTYTYALGVPNTLALGTHTAQASFDNIITGITTQSNTVSFTVTRGSLSDFQCSITNLAQAYSPGQAFQFSVQLQAADPNVTVDPTSGTYTVIFSGPTTITESGLALNNGLVTAHVPSQYGGYAMTCGFDGSRLFSPLMGVMETPILVSRQAHFTAQLYSNPTTVVLTQPFDLYVVFQPATGLPLPTGDFGITLGQNYSRGTPIASGGATLVHVANLPLPYGASQIVIGYGGDANYAPESFTFPMTNPAIPGNAASGPASNAPVGSAGASPTATLSATTARARTITTAATPSPTVAPKNALVAAPQAGSAGLPMWLVAMFAVLVLGGIGWAAFYVVRRRG